MVEDPMTLESQSFYAVPDASSIGLSSRITEPSRSRIDWGFGTTYNSFDLGSDQDLTLSNQEYNFLASLPTRGQEAEPILPFPVASSHALSKAFKRSVGRWDPEKRHYRAAEESHLSLARAGTTKIDCLGDWNSQIFSQNLSSNIRDEILRLVVSSCEQDNIVNIISSFPPIEVIDRLLKSFFTQHATLTDTWIHIPSFQVTDTRLELLIACIASAAARSSSRPIQKFGLALQEFLVFQLWLVAEKANMLTRDLQFLQAFALHLEIGLWSGVKRKMEMSGSFSCILTSSLRGGGHYRYATCSPPTLSLADEGEILEMKWKQWVHEESFKRLVFHAHIYCSQESLMTSGTSTLPHTELSVPVPCSRELWFAKSALEWKRIYLESSGIGQGGRSPSFADILPDPISSRTLSRLYDHRLIQFCLLYSVSTMIRRYWQDKSIFSLTGLSSFTRVSGFSDEVQHQRILYILSQIKSSYEYPESSHSIELDLISDFLSMHLFAPFDQMELAAGKEGLEEAQRAVPSLVQWFQAERPRQAVWHASQVLRAIRMLSPERLMHFYAVAAYHAGLCLWTYGVLSQQVESPPAHNATSTPSVPDEVVLDREESIKAQRWINFNLGVPVISSGHEDQVTNDKRTVRIHSSQALANTLLQDIMSRFSWKNSLLVENVCCLMEALRNIGQGTEGGE
ncbi:uncharacterized protein Z518_10532 [Rhinocladiella mackenziei CBS 650.93]|uniref:Transcription factor domain-containing protein n=1 Tax=Rhinocladiella mackenziei CBS 650.93 TaxID=1442369 RepID=A0A0D2GPX4_9EURO|nr:uncharacterized protein Z518_10532 [Rhinocladiella mackenziei CBS 650.93]KIX00393.1 hypothetical protein Z518_10532 [Rhinocladiella mackenziei CBS 650.93]